MEASHIGMVGNLPHLNVAELCVNAFNDRLSHAHKGFSDVSYFGSLYGIFGLTSIAENLL